MKNLRLVRRIAAGSAVDAFLASSATGSVLVQVSHLEIAADPELYGRFLDTTRVTATKHRHPALLAPEHTSCQPDGRFVLLTGPVSGRTAVDHLRERGPLDMQEAIRWGVRICDAVEFLHSQGVVHGHLAPHNLFLDSDPEHPDIRLLDTALLLFRGTKSVRRRLSLVASQYLSPERCAGHRARPSCDVYGMGILLYQLLTGEPPYSGGGEAEIRSLHRHAPLPSLRPGLEEWEPVLRRCLAKSPGDRFSSMADLRDTLRTLKPLESPAIEVHLGDDEPVPHGADELRPGDVLGRYRIDALIGEGGMAKVFSARHLSIGRQVAIKVLRPELTRVDSQVERFVAEAQAVNRVKHPHVIGIEDLVREAGRVYFVMELLTGSTLKALARVESIELPRAVRLMRQAAEGLAAAHAAGIIHRDVKPDNLVVVRDPTGQEMIKVLDFGVARSQGTDLKAMFKTQVGQVVGTPLWMAPEQVLGQRVDCRADIYSLSMVLFVLLARRYPFDANDLSQMVMMRLSRDATPVGERSFLGEQIPFLLQRMLELGLSREAEKRPPSMEWFAAALKEIEVKLSADEAPTQKHQVSWWKNRGS